MKKLILTIGASLSLASCSNVNERLGLQDDNIGEEIVEDVIKGRTGYDVDITPSTPEKK